jgi:hypothetical protein
MLTDPTFWVGAADRAVKTFAQALLALLGASSQPLDVIHVSWASVLGIAAGMAVLSVLTSLSGLGPDTPATAAAAARRHGAHEEVVTP